jgi:ATP-dependent DNA ligase
VADDAAIQLRVYDCYDKAQIGLKFSERREIYENFVKNLDCESITFVETILAEDEAAMKIMHDTYVHQGHEGVIIRNMDGVYKLKDRSVDLQKYKDFKDDEYEITGYKEAEGNDAGTVVWECVTPEGKNFSVRPKGSREERTQWLKDADKIVGKQLTVRYQELSDERVPRFPSGVAIRDYE